MFLYIIYYITLTHREHKITYGELKHL